MATAAEPQPAVLPLPGGSDGASVRVRPLLTGVVKGPPAMFHREEGRLAALRVLGIGVPERDMVRLPVPAFLVEHPSAGLMLVDTGLHSSVASAPHQNLGRIFLFAFKGLEMQPDQAVAAQLRALGHDPAEVRTVAMTHLHGDHASAMADFPGATFVFSSREWEAAAGDGPLHGYVKRQFDHAFDYRTIDFAGRDVDSYATFGRAADLFGDGSVRLVATPGHTHGHVSVVLRLRERDLLLCGDAAYSMRTFRDSHMPGRVEDEHLFRRSLRELQLFVRQAPDTVVVPGHDMEAFEALDPLYE